MSLDFLIEHRNQFKKVNLYQFVRQHLPLYSIYELTESSNSKSIPLNYIVVKPNHFKKMDGGPFLKINKIDNSVTIDYQLKNKKLEHDNTVDQEIEFQSKIVFNSVESQSFKVIKTILKAGINYKIYDIKNLQGDIDFMLEFISKARSDRDVSVYLRHGPLGGISSKHENDYTEFDIKIKYILNNKIEFSQLVNFRFPLSNGKYCNMFIFNENGVEKVYSIDNNNVSTYLADDAALENYLNHVFEEEVYQAVYYKYGIERQPITPAFWEMYEMASI